MKEDLADERVVLVVLLLLILSDLIFDLAYKWQGLILLFCLGMAGQCSELLAVEKNTRAIALYFESG